MESPIFIVFSGYNPRAVIAFLRGASRAGAEIAVLAAGANDEVFRTAYAPLVRLVRASRELQLESVMGDLIKIREMYKGRQLIIAPSTEALNRFLLKHRRVVEEAGFTLPLVDEKTYLAISDKQSFAVLCRNNGLDVPIEYASTEELRFPCVAKPVTYQNREGRYLNPVILHASRDWGDFLKNHDAKDFFFQEFVRGSSHYLLYYFPEHGKAYRFSQHNLLQQAGGKSIVAAVPDATYAMPVADRYEELFQNLGFRGFVMVELRNTADHRWVMIEANPRFWGPSQLFLDSGCDFFVAFLSDWFPEFFPRPTGAFPLPDVYEKPSSPPTGAYFWRRGIGDRNSVVALSPLAPRPEDYPHWSLADIYNKPDTIELYQSERE
jgi:predicted ATP-grasp superfamily ATP-dependent carboligase